MAEQPDTPSLEGFRADLDVFSGPLDLLLYLVKQEEVDIFEVPVSRVTDRYLEALRTIEFFDVNTAAEFLVVAATLMEIKSRTLLPPGEVEEEEDDGAGTELVRRLLQYKEFKEAADGLENRAKQQVLKHPRPQPRVGTQEEDEYEVQALLEDLAVWDLTAAFAELMTQTRLPTTTRIVHSEVPVSFYIDEVLAALQGAGGRTDFLQRFRGEVSRDRIVGVFLALLEMVRRRTVRVTESAGQPGRRIEVSLADDHTAE